MHRKIAHYLEEHHSILLDRNSECYYDEPTISFDCDEETFDKISEIGSFTIGQQVFTKFTPLDENMKETTRRGKCVYLKIEYLDNDTYHTDITEEGRKKYGAIAPNGKFYECWYEGHRNMEDDLISRGLMSKPKDYKSNGYTSGGWVKLTGAFSVTCEFEFAFAKKTYDYETNQDIIHEEFKITSEQIQTIKAYIESLGRDKFMLNHHFFRLDKIDLLLNATEQNFYDEIYDEMVVKPRMSNTEEQEELEKSKENV